MLTQQRNPCAAQADPALIAAFRNTSTALISDNLARLAGAVDLRPFHRRGCLAGAARTVRTRAGDNPAVHQALDMVRPGDDDGVVAFPQAIAAALLEAVRTQESREAEMLRSIRDGRYDGAYGRVPATSAG